jgi:radical SAM-linked protein
VTNNFKLRLTYAKLPQVAYLSHLETMRALLRMLRRSGLPLALSQGFSPRIRASFGFALPVGTSGAAEGLDCELTAYRPAAEALAALQRSATPAFPVSECHYVDLHAPALTLSHVAFVYQVVFDRPPDKQALEELLARESLVVHKAKGDRTLKLAEFIYRPAQLDGEVLTLYLRATEHGLLKPEQLLAELPEAKVKSICRLGAEPL